ncbi:hypothetical protein Adt_06018 [Abeliophyllum distichum]|uniref:Uncharacterized protein n=1 Tax=Abeliophyllum distichum TaxID=126358 RepID=A0ABD1V5S2_9LAMI
MMRKQRDVEHSRATIESKVANQNIFENGDEEDTKASKDEPLKGECVRKSNFEHRKNNEDDDDAGQLLTIQFGTMFLVMTKNYLLANEFKNKEHDEEIMEENKKAICTLKCREGIYARNQFTHNNDEDEDDGMT